MLRLVCAIFIVEAGLYSSITPLLPHYVHMLRLIERAVGALSASYAVGLVAGSAFAAWLGACVSFRAVAGVGLQILAVSSIICGLASGILLLDLMRFTSGICAGAIWAAGIAWIINPSPPDRRGASLGTASVRAYSGRCWVR